MTKSAGVVWEVDFKLCVIDLVAEDSAKKLLGELGLAPDFFDRLYMEGDWSMIIKLHALFEAVLAGLVVRRLGQPALQEAIVNLEFNHAKSGKVVFARALELIGAREATFLRGLSKLRNSLVHNVRNVSFNLMQHIQDLDSNQRDEFKKQFGHAVCSLDNGEATYTRLLSTHPADIILLGAYACLFTLEFNISDRRRALLVEALLRHGKK